MTASSSKHDTLLAGVRWKCVRLLGALGGSVNNALLQSDQTRADNLVAWDMEKHLKFQVPFVDIKPSIYFGA